MKLLTLNTHSLIEQNYGEKLTAFAEFAAKEKPDIIALQEANQSASEAPLTKDMLFGYTSCADEVAVREDNHAYNAVRLLRERGVLYNWTYVPIKNGYGMFDEGLAVMSRFPIEDTVVFTVSDKDDYRDWKTRKIVGIKANGEWFFSVHYGWWDDNDPFSAQWLKTLDAIKSFAKVWLMGDFNNPAEIRSEGYDLVKASGFYDSYELAEEKDGGITVGGVIDGWRGREIDANGIRIDQIWCSYKAEILKSGVVFNGEFSPVISDHFGVLVYTKG